MAAFLAAINLITSNLGVSFENILLLIVMLGCLTFYAISFQTGAILSFLSSSVLFMAFYKMADYGFSVDYTTAEVVMFGCLVILAVSLLISSKANNPSGVI